MKLTESRILKIIGGSSSIKFDLYQVGKPLYEDFMESSTCVLSHPQTGRLIHA